MVKVSEFGKTEKGIPIELYEITNANGAKVVLTDYGAAIVNLFVPDRNGEMKDVVLGYDTLAEYEASDGNMGAVCGRYANRLRYGEFNLNGETYKLAINNMGVNTLHGGIEGFNRKAWNAVTEDNSVTFSYVSPDMEEGFPGTLVVSVRYDFTDDNELKLTYLAQSDKDTIINLTNHVYFNLDGHDGESAVNMELCVNAPWYTPVNEYLQLTGEVRSVEGTPFDFTSPKLLGTDIEADDPQLKIAGGYDHTFVFEKSERNAFEKCAELRSPHSGIAMEVYTTKPATQIYTANMLTPRKGKGGADYKSRDGVCIETHYFPDAMFNSHFPSPVLKKGETYEHITSFKFI